MPEVSDQKSEVSTTARDIVDNVWEKAKAFGRQEFALEIERLIHEIQAGSSGPFFETH